MIYKHMIVHFNHRYICINKKLRSYFWTERVLKDQTHIPFWGKRMLTWVVPLFEISNLKANSFGRCDKMKLWMDFNPYFFSCVEHMSHFDSTFDRVEVPLFPDCGKQTTWKMLTKLAFFFFISLTKNELNWKIILKQHSFAMPWPKESTL
jgi:hypothetical protein